MKLIEEFGERESK